MHVIQGEHKNVLFQGLLDFDTFFVDTVYLKLILLTRKSEKIKVHMLQYKHISGQPTDNISSLYFAILLKIMELINFKHISYTICYNGFKLY